MTREARLMSGIILVTVPTIQYGGYFLLTSLTNSGYMEDQLRQNFFRAGHAHAGVIVILSLTCQMLVLRNRWRIGLVRKTDKFWNVLEASVNIMRCRRRLRFRPYMTGCI